MRSFSLELVLVAALLCVGVPEARSDGTAGEMSEEIRATTPPPSSYLRPWEGPWRFNFAAWGWLPDIPVEVKTPISDSTLPENFGTILEDLQFTAMLDFELRKGRLGAYVTPLFLFLKDTEHVPGAVPGRTHKITIDESATLIDFGFTYELGPWDLAKNADWFHASPVLAIEPFVGARSLVDDLKFKIQTNSLMGPLPNRTFKPEISFIAPVLGLQTFWDLTERLNVRIEGDYGGFGVDDLRQTWNVMGAAGYRFRPWQSVSLNLFVGYRYLYAHYKTNIIDLKATVRGPILGLGFEFGRRPQVQRRSGAYGRTP